jgi:hypothetical protein
VSGQWLQIFHKEICKRGEVDKKLNVISFLGYYESNCLTSTRRRRIRTLLCRNLVALSLFYSEASHSGLVQRIANPRLARASWVRIPPPPPRQTWLASLTCRSLSFAQGSWIQSAQVMNFKVCTANSTASARLNPTCYFRSSCFRNIQSSSATPLQKLYEFLFIQLLLLANCIR